MTAPSIISDQEAREIAESQMRLVAPTFIATGVIGSERVLWAMAVLADRRHWHAELVDLAVYVAHHGERGPVEGWDAL